MFILRNVREDDLEELYELAQLQVFINLPADRVKLQKKIETSQKSFHKPSSILEENYFIFVLEDIENNVIIGTSMIHGKHGTEEEPHFYLKVGQEHKYSKSLNTGFIHGTLKFGLETDGYSEIGGLVLNPSYRGQPGRLGKQLSFVRFLYMAEHLEQFTDFIHVELMPPFDTKGNSPLWEAIGRKFLNIDYMEADKLSRENKEFILSLYPIDTIYETLLPASARNSIGKVGPQTLPVKNMLEKIGFHYTEEVDPFDGGPHYRAKTTQIKPIKNKIEGLFKPADLSDENELERIIVQVPQDNNEFLSFATEAKIKENEIYIDEKLSQKLKINQPFESVAIYF